MSSPMEEVQHFFAKRPIWMNGVLLFCGYMTFVYMPYDLFVKPVADDQEVWFGLLLTGWAAKATAPLHWIIYGFGFYGLVRMKPWLFRWAPLYLVQIAIGMFVWAINDPRGGGLLLGATAAIPFLILAAAFWTWGVELSGEKD